MENKKSINFFSSSDNEKYNMFILPHICSVLHHVENSSCEIVISNAEKFKSENALALDLINNKYPNKVLIREIPKKFLFLKKYYKLLGQIIRFLDEPWLRSDYTYIGDIDIITMDSNIISIHEELMKKQELPYSNIVRPNTERLTGCMFVDHNKYYRKIDTMIHRFLRDVESFYHPILNDEILLYKLVTPRLGLPKHNEEGYRPIHGIHMSLNRPEPLGKDGIPGWSVNKRRLNQYIQFKNSDFYKSLYPYFKGDFKNMVSKLDNLEL